MRRITSLALTGCLLISSTSISLAGNDAIPVLYNQEAIPVLYNQEVNPELYNVLNKDCFFINDKEIKLDSKKIYQNDAGTIMIPLRILSEELGYDVKWNEELNAVELTKGPHWIMVKTKENYYSFGKMAPVELKASAEIIEGTTFVPLDYVTDILKYDVKVDVEGTVMISTSQNESLSQLLTLGMIKDIIKNENNTMVLIENIGSDTNENIILNIGENTKIIDMMTNDSILVEDLIIGETIRGYYGPAVTASIPPQANAHKIEVFRDVALRQGTITDIINEGDRKQVVIGDYMTGIILIISDETIFVTEDDEILKFEDLQIGMEIEALHDQVMTMSIPAMTSAKKIIVKN